MFKLLFLLLFISANNCFAKEVKFHKAETEAEKTLDNMLTKAGKDDAYANKLNDCLTTVDYVLTDRKNEFGYIIQKAVYKKLDDSMIQFCKQYFTEDLLKDFPRIFVNYCNAPNDINLNDGGYCWIDSGIAFCGNGGLPKTNFLYHSQKIDNNSYLIHYTWLNRIIDRNKIKYSFIKTESDLDNFVNNSSKNYIEAELSDDIIYGLYIIKKENNTWKIDSNNCIENYKKYYSTN